MKSNARYLIISLATVLVGALAVGYWHFWSPVYNVKTCRDFQFRSYGFRGMGLRHMTSDSFVVDYDRDGKLDLVTLGLPMGNQPSGLIQLIHNQGGGNFVDVTSLVLPKIATIHARHILVDDINGDGISDFVVADHGADRPPFSGGVSRFVMSSPKGYGEISVPLPPAFSFHVSSVDWNGDGRADIYLSNLNGTTPPPMVLIQNKNGQLVWYKELLPSYLAEQKNCFMSSHAVDLDGDGIKELVLGGCDRADDQHHQIRDLVLERKEGRYKLSSRFTLAPRMPNSTWGTAAWNAADLDGDGKMDLVGATHNFGFTRGGVQIYYGKELGKSIAISFQQKSNGFVPWIAIGDVDGDQRKDIGFVVRPGNEIHLFKNQGQDDFVDVGHCLATQLKDVAMIHIGDFLNNGRPQILLHSDGGDIELLERVSTSRHN